MPRNAIAKLEDGCPPWAEGLTDRERAFVEQYIVDLNPTEAAVRASIGKTRKSSTEVASRLRKKPIVAAAISRLMSERAGVSGAGVINEIARLAFSKATDFARVVNGALIVTDTDELSEDQKAAIAEISETVGEGGRTVRVKLHDKLTALDKLAKVLSLYKERVEISGPNGSAIQIETTIADVRAKLDDKMARLRAALTFGLDEVEVQPPLRRVASVPVRAIGRVIEN